MDTLVPDWVIVGIFLSIILTVIGSFIYLIVSKIFRKNNRHRLGNPQPASQRIWDTDLYG